MYPPIISDEVGILIRDPGFEIGNWLKSQLRDIHCNGARVTINGTRTVNYDLIKAIAKRDRKEAGTRY